MATQTVRNPNDLYFEYAVISGPWKGLEARMMNQPQLRPEFADFEIRDRKVVRGPIRLPLSSVKWQGPHA